MRFGTCEVCNRERDLRVVCSGIGGRLGVGILGENGPNTAYIPPGTIDEVAVWNVTRHTADFAPPSAPYNGDETGLKALWHLDGNGAAGV